MELKSNRSSSSQREPHSSHYFKWYLGFSVFFSLGYISLQWTSDILGIFRPAQNFNQPRAIPLDYERLHKAFAVQAKKVSALVLGTSRGHLGFRSDEMGTLTSLEPYNFALGGASLYESLLVLKQAHAIHPVKRILLEIDIFNYQANRKTPAELSKEWFTSPWKSRLKTLASRELFYLGMKKITGEQAISFSLNRYGDLTPVPSLYTDAHTIFRDWVTAAAPGLKSLSVNNFEACQENETCPAGWLEEILEFCLKNDISVDAYFPPYHSSILSLLNLGHRPGLLDIWKEHVENVFRKTTQSKTASLRLWDFAYPNRVTTEAVPEVSGVPMEFYFDNNHFRPTVGSMILKLIFGGEQNSAFGVLRFEKNKTHVGSQ